MINARIMTGYTWVISTAGIIGMIEGVWSKEGTDWTWQFFVDESKR